MTQPTIPSTALLPVEFIPATQDAEAYKRLKTSEIRQREQALERAVAAPVADDASQEEIAARADEHSLRAEAIQTEWALMERTLNTMKALYPVPQKFLISVPTSVEREQINSRLISLGLAQITQEMIRSTMIEELFNQDWSVGGATLSPAENEAKAEEHANFLDSVWQRQQAHDAAVQAFEEQERERILDELHGAPAQPRADLPVKIITVREGAKMQLLIDRMMTQSQRLRDLAAAAMDFSRRNSVLLVRMHLVAVEGFTPLVPIERDPFSRAISEEAVNALREQVDDASWTDLVTFIDRMYQVDGGEEKNSASLPGKLSPLGGSIEASDAPASSGGSSTGSSSEPLPAGGSETTIGTSSGSTSDSSTAPVTDPTSSLTVAH